MTYLASELITEAYYLSGIVAQGEETVGAAEMSTGFRLLNDSLADKISDMSLIPFYKEAKQVTVANQADYFFPGLLAIETFTFNNAVGNPVRFATINVGRKQFRGQSQVDNVSTLISSWHAERSIDENGIGGTTISLYPLPSGVFPITVWGKFGLDEIPSEDTDLRLTYERGYLVYMRFELAAMLSEEYGVTLPPSVERRLNQYRTDFDYISPLDLSVQKCSTLNSHRRPDFLAIAYLSNGWVPGGRG